VFGLQLGNIAKDRFKGRRFAGCGVVDHELKDVTAIRSHLFRARQSRCKERPGGERNQSGSQENPAFVSPAMEHGLRCFETHLD
jgi:hypothetical protein